MKKVAIVGVEGSGKTVMLACLGELYTTPDEQGYFLDPENFQTAAYVMDKISRLRNGEWPMATSDDVMQELNWTLRRRNPGGCRPEEICEISFLDFGGEVYRAAFGIRGGVDEALSNEIKQLKDYVSAADELIVLINLRDIINNGVSDRRVQESIWITSSILKSALNRPNGSTPRASIAITQADSYADTIRTCGGARGVLAKYLPHVSNSYDWLDIFYVTAVDKTVIGDDGNPIPDPSFKSDGLRVLMDWIINSGEKDGSNTNSHKAKNTRLAIEAYEAKRWEEAFQLSENADRNDSMLQCYLGKMYAAGRGVARDDSEAVKWFHKSVEQGNADAQNCLGFMYANGRGVKRDDSEAVKWYRKAAEQGNAAAQFNLGFMYDEGRGVRYDVPEAIRWCHKAAEHGYAPAQNNLGLMYEDGLGVVKDERAYRMAAAQYNLGRMYANGEGVAKDDREAVKWYRKAAELGNANAQFCLGNRYKTGRGVTQDDSEAKKWFRKAADQGHSGAQSQLGFIDKISTVFSKILSCVTKWRAGEGFVAFMFLTGLTEFT